MAAKPYLYPVRHPKGKVPDIVSGKYKTGESIIQGTLLAHDANGELIVHLGVANLDVAGVALEKAASKPGWDAANSPTVITGRVQEVSYAQADQDTVWTLRAESGGTITNPTQTRIAEEYGVLNSSGEWRLDLTDTTDKIFRVVDIDLNENLWFVKFIAAALEIA